ncbi:protein of unknown function [Peptoniphilus asaccharolyticus DSM 20463]|uniref:DUF3842 family protein n=1 Tax=Peptoniphilus asaccharolyticus DSM 20463 TaxID=573058 RepID=A0A1W1V6D8_PEPAS|nr:DUF3842 family protein [Peptoniphilus asaccharolyticus]MBL7576362.1 DUF3842 family protein [Peptoniphilus asaccharolyticus]SMB88574.1 protein of unknown function [Peptoniphilus asaccharolyticus DSM 20463]
MKVLVIDAQGGGLGKQVVQALKKNHEDLEIIAVGTNSIATTSMLKAGADFGATGENAVVVNCAKADIIVGPIGILLTNSLYGEITARMAEAVSLSRAKRVLIPFLHDDNVIVGINDYSIKKLIELAVSEVEKIL